MVVNNRLKGYFTGMEVNRGYAILYPQMYPTLVGAQKSKESQHVR